MGDVDSQVVALAAKNGGIISRAEAIALGMSDRTIRRRIADGYLMNAGAGVLALPGINQSEETALRAACASLDCVVSHESAARLHGITGLDPSRWTVSVPVRRSYRFSTLRVHQLTDLDKHQTTEVKGIPVTDPPRTVLDLSSVLPKEKLAEIADQFVTRRLTSYVALRRRLDELARQGKKGVVNLRSVLDIRLEHDLTPESTLESRLLGVLLRGGLPTPTTQFRPRWLRHVSGRVDLAYKDERVIVEGDSRRWHSTPEAFQLDRKRDNLAQIAGWTILRFTWDDITKREEYVVTTVRNALELSRSRTGQIRPTQP